MRLDFDIADMPIIEVVCNCISCLPSFPTDSAVGEFELITSYLDPVLRPLLHDPDEMRLLRWTNRVCTELSNDFSRRPDGTLTLREQFHGASALGFCEVKPADSGQNAELCFTDLLRLALFSKSGIDKGEIQGMMVVHAIGPAVTFYVMELAGPGLYPLVELATITMPLTIDDLSPFLMRLSLLKQVHVAYHRHSKHLDQKARSKFDKWRKSSMTAEELQDVINITASKDKAPNIHV
ncbi:hypothetical protein BCR43DRAFT_500330 [Syncephalastrum racemosum]|uniref:Uncharacterized protein n=1 Tax=Syncephalastrum racemosum TaxID=13706 RepID=A0A1X2HRT8_SYNRA|nr:hypothetical protein BCR43DRAFT_500330 [Syncephalastrum racemosum]